MRRMSPSVLVVDDDAAFRALAAKTLRSWGCDVVGEAGTFGEGVERTTALEPAAVLVDIGLPDGDGFTLARQLSALPWRPRVVLISSDADSANGAVARRNGAIGFVPKEELVSATLRRMITGA
jgi:CheY-like chemotaxis protein